ncbi:bifunctional 3,4-dihydroxy-2-butanone-4-phosphate synthase/GTP cyclohydrolase II, partial [Candidatus Woesearchaeota archaeon]|nr:bifunctional 3,4-dihydroxy-2-butanone-4-phosphate synthase/GTP cyclohydrolase II [Candidatus Woesearchaeota archaeon]
NMKKAHPLKQKDIHVVMTPVKIEPNEHNSKYLETKKARMGHRL